MPYFSNAPGPTPSEELPHPKSILEKIKNKSDAINKSNLAKRKLSDENAGKFIEKKKNSFLKICIKVLFC